MTRLRFVLATAALSATALLAQGQGRMGGGPPGGGPRGGDGTPPDPATMVQRRVDMLAERLSLTDDQKTKATAIFTTAVTATQPLQTSLQTNHQALQTAIKTNPSTIDAISATIGQLQGQVTAANAKAESAFYAILTADQKAKFDQGMGRGMMGGFGGPGPMMRGPGGPGMMRRGGQNQ